MVDGIRGMLLRGIFPASVAAERIAGNLMLEAMARC